MARTPISTTGWTQVIDTSTVDTLIALEGGDARLTTASGSETRTDGVRISAIEKIVVPAGVDAWLWADDQNVVAVDIDFGV